MKMTRKIVFLGMVAGAAFLAGVKYLNNQALRYEEFYNNNISSSAKSDEKPLRRCGGMEEEKLTSSYQNWLDYNAIGVKVYDHYNPETDSVYHTYEVWSTETDEGQEQYEEYSSDAGLEEQEVELLTMLCYAEQTRAGYAQSEHDREAANIVMVVLNRVESEEYPDSIEGVIFDTKYGKQFSPANASNSTIEWYPEAGKKATMTWTDVPEETKRQVQDALDGQFRNRGYLFYYASKEDVPGKDRICGTVFY